MQKLLIIAGLILLFAGLAWPLLRRLGIGRLPGDLVWRGENSTVYFPIMTCIALSLALTLIMWLVNR